MMRMFRFMHETDIELFYKLCAFNYEVVILLKLITSIMKVKNT